MKKNSLSFGLASQMLASLSMLKDCIDRCPQEEWNESHNDYPFSQVVFHALFDCDYNLSEDISEFKEQELHRHNGEAFGNYEELDDSRPRKFYDREFVDKYYEHCSRKVVSVIEANTPDDLLRPKSDIYETMTKMERYINAIRHIQHHSAQLGLRLQFSTGKEMDWVSRGFEE